MVFGTLVGVFVFSVMWSELLMTSVISCPMWSSVYEWQRVECAFISLVVVVVRLSIGVSRLEIAEFPDSIRRSAP